MDISEVRELLDLKGWNQVVLAGMLHVTPDAVRKWFKNGKVPDGPAALWMIAWLNQARKKVKVSG